MEDERQPDGPEPEPVESLPTPRQLFLTYGSAALYAIAAIIFLVNGEILGWIGVILAVVQIVLGIRAQRRLKAGLASRAEEERPVD